MRVFLFVGFFFLSVSFNVSSKYNNSRLEKVELDLDSLESKFLIYSSSPHKIKFYWKDNNGRLLGSLENLKKFVENQDDTLRFAMNGGMYLKDRSPQGLFVEDGELKSKLDTVSKGYGNFYMQPNGVFSISESGKASIVTSKQFNLNDSVNFATQSGPMLVIDSVLHPKFNEGSKNVKFETE